jgi:excisionase family DNA binding protein
MAAMDGVPQMLPIDALPDRLGVSQWTVRTWVRQGRIAYTKVGRRLLVKTEDVAALLEENYRAAARQA